SPSASTLVFQSANFGEHARLTTDAFLSTGNIIVGNGASTTAQNKGLYVWTDKQFGFSLLYNSNRWNLAIQTRSSDGGISFGKGLKGDASTPYSEFANFDNAGVFTLWGALNMKADAWNN